MNTVLLYRISFQTMMLYYDKYMIQSCYYIANNKYALIADDGRSIIEGHFYSKAKMANYLYKMKIHRIQFMLI